ncbi:MAG: M23 family metallopeptidase [Bacteroidales bacterium]|nr:M23 family metallopeptidase [Bacteroidales bacterium]
MYRRLFLISCFWCFVLFCHSQQNKARTYELPIRMVPYLSGNFGELRSNHFHSGIDFKTQGSTGHPVYSFDDGWVSRISVSPWGYGKALYINHYNGMTTVYGHLLSFNQNLNNIVKNIQYENESFSFDKSFDKDEIIVKRGELIAKSGNSGSSGGPHLHFEIRDTQSQDPIDPLPFFINKITDTKKPEIKLVRVYPLKGKGIVNDSNEPASASIVKKEDGSYSLNKTFSAWGEIGLGVKAYDYMDNTTNIYGVKNIRMFVDDSLYFSQQINRFSFSETRYLNSLTDFSDWVNNRSMVVKLYKEPNNQLSIYNKLVNNGIIDINKERIYKIRYELSDAKGNKRIFNFNIKGIKGEIPYSNDDSLMEYSKDNRFENENFSINIAKNSLYDDVNFSYTQKDDSTLLSNIHLVCSYDIPLHKSAKYKIKITNDTISDKSKYYVASLGKNLNGNSSMGGEYNNGWMEFSASSFGNFCVMKDVNAPKIEPVNQKNWGKTGVLKFRISDNETGISSWRPTIDDKYALFEYDGKTSTISYKIDIQRIGKDKNHNLKIILIDNCGNTTEYNHKFYW